MVGRGPHTGILAIPTNHTRKGVPFRRIATSLWLPEHLCRAAMYKCALTLSPSLYTPSLWFCRLA